MGMQHRAYSLLEIKAADDDARVIEGIATTPTPDRMGDIVEPKGAEFKLPIPLLWQHDHRQPIGEVFAAKVTADGISIKARFAKIDEPGKLKDRIDEAWQSIKAKLVKGLSIGFREIESAFIRETGSFHFTKWEWIELSAVTVPAQAEATIQTIKSLDQQQRAASGNPLHRVVAIAPGVSGTTKPKAQPERATPMKTIAEQIAAFEATRQAKAARMEAIMTEASEKGVTLDAAQTEEYDTLKGEVESIDAHLKRLQDMEKLKKTTATIVKGTTQEEGSASRGSAGPRVEVLRKGLPPGIAFTRYIGAKWFADRHGVNAADYAKKKWGDSSPEVSMILRAAVEAGNTTDSAWAEPLVQLQNLSREFIEYLWPKTIIGRLNGFRRVPFNVKVPRQTDIASVNWIGEGKVKPVSELAFDQVELRHTKLAGIVICTDELLRFSDPSAETTVRDTLAKGIIKLMDQDFVDPSKSEASGVSPASITYGATPIVASGNTAAALRLDLGELLDTFHDVNLETAGGHFIMTQSQASRISLMMNSLGTGPEFPGITPEGGTLLGYPVVASQNVPSVGNSPVDGGRIIFCLPSEILLADDGQVAIDVSREASVQMDSSPDSPATASTVLVSLWQHNMTGFRAERTVNWKKCRDEAANYINGAKYGTS